MATSLKEYLKKYENPVDDDKKKKKKKKPKPVATGVLVVDEDPVWQKPVIIEEEEEDNDAIDECPQVNEDIEVKRMRRLEMLRASRAYNQISEDGSGWVSVSDMPKDLASGDTDISPPRNRRARYDTPSPGRSPVGSGREAADSSPPRRRQRRNDSPSPGPRGLGNEGSDMSPPRRRRPRDDSPSPGPRNSGREGSDLSPPRQRRRVNTSPSLHPEPGKEVDLSPPNKRGRRYDSPSPEPGAKASVAGDNKDLSPPRRRGQTYGSPSSRQERNRSVSDLHDLSPPRRGRPSSPKRNDVRGSDDLSPPRKSRKGIEVDLSPPRKSKDKRKNGLITGKDVSEEITKLKKDEWARFNAMDSSTSGQGAEAVYRIKGQRISKDEHLKLTKKEEKPKEEKKLEWGKGLAQKREAEARIIELETEKAKPFARSRDDPDLDRMMKDRLRWGDPMAHLVKKKQSDLVLPDLGDSEKMKESGFIVPQEVPSHSWLKRGLDCEPNRYGIKPGRHWDGVNRSNGYEKQMFKRMSEKRATEKEAYLWSVSDM